MERKTHTSRHGAAISWLLTLMLLVFGSSMTLTGCGGGQPESGGARQTKMDPRDQEQSRAVMAVETPAASLQSVHTNLTITYLNEGSFFKKTTYTIETPADPAQLVKEQNNSFMTWVDGKLYRFDIGNRAGMPIDKPMRNVATAPASAKDGDRDDTPQNLAPQAVEAPQAASTANINIGYNRYRISVQTYEDLRYPVPQTDHADYVPGQKTWMRWLDGNLYQFVAGTTAGTQIGKPTRDVTSTPNGASSNDREEIQPDLHPRALETPMPGNTGRIAIGYTRFRLKSETYEDLRYPAAQSDYADYVPGQTSWMRWLDGKLYQFVPGNTAGTNIPKPLRELQDQSERLDASDQFQTTVPAVRQVPSIWDANADLIMRDWYFGQRTYEKLSYPVKTVYNAQRDNIQNGWMCWVDNVLYKVDGLGNITHWDRWVMPTIDISASPEFQIRGSDYIGFDLIPTDLTTDQEGILVIKRNNYGRKNQFEKVVYHIDKLLEARKIEYSPGHYAYGVKVDNKIYIVAYADDVIIDRGPDVVVVPAPPSLKKPKVVVVPGPEDKSSPSTVVPAPPTKTSAQKVINSNTDASSPSAVPIPEAPAKKKKHHPKVLDSNADSGTPGVVIPSAPRR